MTFYQIHQYSKHLDRPTLKRQLQGFHQILCHAEWTQLNQRSMHYENKNLNVNTIKHRKKIDEKNIPLVYTISALTYFHKQICLLAIHSSTIELIAIFQAPDHQPLAHEFPIVFSYRPQYLHSLHFPMRRIMKVSDRLSPFHGQKSAGTANEREVSIYSTVDQCFLPYPIRVR